jgi:hypothetical protein
MNKKINKLSQPHTIFSTENSIGENPKVKHNNVLKHLKNKGLDAHSIDGNWKGSKEKNILVFNPDKNSNKLDRLAHSLGQEAIIHSDGYSHSIKFLNGDHAGKEIKGRGIIHHGDNKPDSNYSSIDGHHFSHVFDTEKAEDKPTHRWSEFPQYESKKDSKLKSPDSGNDKFETSKGTIIELEHTDDINTAQTIASHHLAENQDYYKFLEIMESKEWNNFVNFVIKVMNNRGPLSDKARGNSEKDIEKYEAVIDGWIAANSLEKGEIARALKGLGLSLAMAHGAHYIGQQQDDYQSRMVPRISQATQIERQAPQQTVAKPMTPKAKSGIKPQQQMKQQKPVQGLGGQKQNPAKTKTEAPKTPKSNTKE